MKTLVKKTITFETKGHYFGNGIIYVQKTENSRIVDWYFANEEDIFPNGTLKAGKKRLFYSPYEDPSPEDRVVVNRPMQFKWFDRLFFVDDDGLVKKAAL